MFVSDSEGSPLKKGDLVKCITPLDGISKNSRYEILLVQPEALRVVVKNDQGKEQWVLARRFLKARQPFCPGDLARRIKEIEVLEVVSYCPESKIVSLKDEASNFYSIESKHLEKLQLEFDEE